MTWPLPAALQNVDNRASEKTVGWEKAEVQISRREKHFQLRFRCICSNDGKKIHKMKKMKNHFVKSPRRRICKESMNYSLENFNRQIKFI